MKASNDHMKRKLLIISSEFPPNPGGIGNHAYNVAFAFYKKGYDISVLTNEPDHKVDGDFPEPFPVVRIKRAGYQTYWNRYVAARKMVRGTHDILATGKFSLWLAYVLKIEQPKLTVTAVVHGTELNIPSIWQKSLTERALQKADRIIAVSEFTKSLLSSWNRLKCLVIPKGIDLDQFDNDYEEIDLMMQGTPKLLTVGNVTRRKGQHQVISALPEILKEFPNTVYHIVGIPTERATLENEIERLGLKDRVIFYGRLSKEELNHAYRQCDVFVMLSENQPNGDVEGFGIAIIEANAMGVPAIGSKGTGIEEAINGENGLLADSHDPKDVTEALKTIMTNREKFQKKARQFAEQHNWNELIDRYVAFMMK
jgi:phosphatidylinositol alpha-1,6-mannosyltransferase